MDSIRILKEVNQKQEIMISKVAHDIRTSINCVYNMMEFLTEKIDKNLVAKYVDPAKYSSKFMLCLLNDLLDQAQMKNDKFQLVYKRFNLIKLIEDITLMIQYAAKSKKVDLIFHIDPNINQHLAENFNSDPNRITQVLINLVSNAIKFTPKKGTITIILKQIMKKKEELKQAFSNKFQIIVKDTGIGIKKEDQQKLFQNFSKLNIKENSVLNPQGVGLGLAISEQLARSLQMDSLKQKQIKGASIIVESNENQLIEKGSQFSFIIRNQKLQNVNQLQWIEEQQEEVLVEDLEENSFITKKMPVSLKMQPTFYRNKQNEDVKENFVNQEIDLKKKILLVDDFAFNLEILEEHFINLGFKQIDKCYSGKECIDQVQEQFLNHQTYDYIFLDIEMPQIDGYQTAEELHQFNFNKKIHNSKIIACSGYEISNCQDKFFTQALRKPVFINDLKQCLISLQTIENI